MSVSEVCPQSSATGLDHGKLCTIIPATDQIIAVFETNALPAYQLGCAQAVLIGYWVMRTLVVTGRSVIAVFKAINWERTENVNFVYSESSTGTQNGRR